MTVSDRVSMLLQQKGSTIFSVPPQATVYSAIELMAEKSVGALLVIDKGKLLIPFVKAICVDIRPEEKLIRVDLPPGLEEAMEDSGKA